MKAIGYEYLRSKHDSCPPGWATGMHTHTHTPASPSLGAATIAFSCDLMSQSLPTQCPTAQGSHFFTPENWWTQASQTIPMLVQWLSCFRRHRKHLGGLQRTHIPAVSTSGDSESRVGCGKLQLSQASPAGPRGPGLGGSLLAETQ